MLAPVEKQFWLRAEHNIAVREACIEAVAAAKAEAGPRFEHPADSWRGDVERREYAAAQAKLKAASPVPVQVPFLGPNDRYPDDDLGEADGEMSDGDFALILIGRALADKRFQTYEAHDWTRFLKAIARQLRIDDDALRGRGARRRLAGPLRGQARSIGRQEAERRQHSHAAPARRKGHTEMTELPKFRPFTFLRPAAPPTTPTPPAPGAIDAQALAAQIVLAGKRRRGEEICAMPEQPPPEVVADPVVLGKAIVAAAKKARSAT
jgi:hypothetical protein